MKDWKENLPNYEPSEGSWFRLKSSLHLEEQLRRQLPELPQHTPRATAWKGIEEHLEAAEKAKPFLWYRWAAAAVIVLCCSLWGIWQLPNDKKSQQLVVQQPPAVQSTAIKNAAEPVTELPVQQEETVAAVPGEVAGTAQAQPKAAMASKTKAFPKVVMQPLPVMQKQTEELPEAVITQHVLESKPEQPAAASVQQAEPIKPQQRSHHKKIAIQWNGSEPKTVNIAFEGPTTWPEREKVAVLNEPEKLLKLQLNN